jgi:hypothetical protein
VNRQEQRSNGQIGALARRTVHLTHELADKQPGIDEIPPSPAASFI